MIIMTIYRKCRKIMAYLIINFSSGWLTAVYSRGFQNVPKQKLAYTSKTAIKISLLL